MKEFNCVRRVDKLGRIVLPKEVRKRLKIEEGSQLELVTGGEEITLKKICPFKNNYLLALFINEFYNEFKKPILVVFDGEVIASSAKSKKYINMHIYDKKGLNEAKNGDFVQNFQVFNEFYSPITLFKLVTFGDEQGCFIVLDRLTEKEEFICKMFARMLQHEGWKVEIKNYW